MIDINFGDGLWANLNIEKLRSEKKKKSSSILNVSSKSDIGSSIKPGTGYELQKKEKELKKKIANEETAKVITTTHIPRSTKRNEAQVESFRKTLEYQEKQKEEHLKEIQKRNIDEENLRLYKQEEEKRLKEEQARIKDPKVLTKMKLKEYTNEQKVIIMKALYGDHDKDPFKWDDVYNYLLSQCNNLNSFGYEFVLLSLWIEVISEFIRLGLIVTFNMEVFHLWGLGILDFMVICGVIHTIHEVNPNKYKYDDHYIRPKKLVPNGNNSHRIKMLKEIFGEDYEWDYPTPYHVDALNCFNQYEILKNLKKSRNRYLLLDLFNIVFSIFAIRWIIDLS